MHLDATQHAALQRAVKKALAALERVGCADAGNCDVTLPDGQCFVCAAHSELAAVTATESQSTPKR